MHTRDEKQQGITEQTGLHRLFCQFTSIRVRLTLWYAITTLAMCLFFDGLLYSTIAKMMPTPDNSALPGLGLQLFLMALVLLLFILVGGYWLAVRAMRPVHLITRTAREIGQTDLSRRIHLNRRDELGELADTFDEMLNRLEVVLSRQRQFTADASHELRTPLSILKVVTNRALAQWSRPDNYEQALDSIKAYQQEFSIIQAETDRMTHLMNGLLLLARADIEQTLLTTTEVDVSEVTLEVVERFAPLAHQRGIALTFGELPELRVNGDRLLLTLLVTNLVDNALKYTAGIGDRVLVEGSITRRGEKRWGRVWIEDNGPGIAEEHQPHLFERFYRVDIARLPLQMMEEDSHEETTSGSGLGLAIVQWVAQVHSGEIHLLSTIGHGSHFEVWLPLMECSDTLAQQDM